MSDPEQLNRSTVTPTARVYIVLVIVAIAPFGILLYLYPAGAPRYWAWTVAEPRTAMLIGQALGDVNVTSRVST